MRGTDFRVGCRRRRRRRLSPLAFLLCRAAKATSSHGRRSGASGQPLSPPFPRGGRSAPCLPRALQAPAGLGTAETVNGPAPNNRRRLSAAGAAAITRRPPTCRPPPLRARHDHGQRQPSSVPCRAVPCLPEAGPPPRPGPGTPSGAEPSTALSSGSSRRRLRKQRGGRGGGEVLFRRIVEWFSLEGAAKIM